MSPLELRSGEIHLWRADLDPDRKAIPALAHALAPEERAKAGQFHFELDRDRYIVAHGALRAILAKYHRTAPGDLIFRYGPQGKPELVNGAAVHFSMSHSRDLFVCAIGRVRHLGVDVEHVRPGDVEEIARCLSSRARRVLEALPHPARRRAFFQGWARMEAYSKARGDELTSGLETFDLFLNRRNAVLLPPPGNAERGRRWWVHDFSPRGGYVGALAAPRGKYRVRCWRWRPDETGNSTQVNANQTRPCRDPVRRRSG